MMYPEDVSRTIATAKMELFIALVSSFQPLTNFTKNLNIGVMRLYNTITYYEICAGEQIKYCSTIGISSYLATQTLFTSKFSGSY